MMKRFLCFVLLASLLVLGACSSPASKPADPTPNVQAKLESQTASIKLFTDIRYAFGLLSDAFDAISTQLAEAERSGALMNVQGIISFFNEPENLVSHLTGLIAELEKTKSGLMEKRDANEQTIKNLGDLINILNLGLPALKTTPENSMTFRSKIEDIKSKFNLIENLLAKDFPGSNSDLSARKSPEDPVFRKDRRFFQYQPKQIPTMPPVEPAADASQAVSATDESQAPVIPAKMWRDAKGNLHFDQNPPEGAVIEEPNGAVSYYGTPQESPAPSAVDEPSGDATPAEPQATAPQSLIWKDAEGNVHMGATAPEGAEVKRAEDIPFLISK